ncbi:MAG: pilus assembly protein PilY [Acinetobacter sp.]
MKNFNQKLLSASVSMLMTMSICHVTTAYASDIDIYKLPDKTKLTIMMMLDLSGSMDAPYMSTQNNDNGYSACDLPSKESIDSVVSGEISANGYTKNYCQKGGTLKYYYRSNKAQTSWWDCGSSGVTLNDLSINNCKQNPTGSAPNLDGYVKDTSQSNQNDYYYKYSGGTKKYDRISRLKDALYELAISNKIPSTTKIGVGTYSYNGSGDKGYIRIAANEWGAVGSTQRNKLLTLINSSGFSGRGGTPTATAYAEAASALLGTTTGGGGYSGVGQAEDSSTEVVSSKTYYKRPVDDTEPKCSGKGVYVLTDGLPSTKSGAATIMTEALKKRGASTSGYTTSYSNTLSTFGTDKGANSGWNEIGYFAQSLNDGNNLKALFNSVQRNDQHQVKTAVVGFGSVFDVLDPAGTIRKKLKDHRTGAERTYYNCSLLTGVDQQNACYWGNKTKFSDGTIVPDIGNPKSYGEGGFYSASSTTQVVESFINFVDDMKPNFEPIGTGSPTIPVDSLNPIQLQPYGYYAQFTPKPQETYQLWLGNLNKYHIKDGRLYDTTKLIELITSSGELNKTATGIWGANANGGVVGKLPLGTAANGISSKRTVYTNRQINASNVAEEANSLQSVNLTTLFDADANKAKFKNDVRKNYWLNILGYNIDIDATGLTVATLPTNIRRQLGAVMHSKPVLLTQEGKIEVTDGVVGTTARKDYLMFGSTQGSLHVVKVDNDTDSKEPGEEVFTFVPHEMIQNKPEAFLSESAVNGGRDNLYYGMDGAWTAYTQYVSKTDKTLTVSSSGRKDNDGKDLNQTGLQWVYGGLRMGGQSYYALDLTNINSPSLKFHIDPKNQNIVNSSTTKTVSPLQYMGDSWSKPTIAWVNWGGTRKLVMFVGGGYDSTGTVQCGDATKNDPNTLDYDQQNKYNDKGYECPKYNQAASSNKKKGAGVYMFDAGNGDLLWWASANVGTSTSAATNSGVIATNDANLQYSVVSQINAVDRDADGLVDHLFFGDLGGQAFRIDLNNKATTLGVFAKRVVRLYNAHVTNGASPRFYEMPSFSVHSGVDGLFGVVALSSGNRSSPLAGVHRINGTDVTTATANDGVYVVYDNDVARSDLYGDITLRTSPTGAGVTLTDVSTFATLKAGIAQTTGTGTPRTYNGGWKYQYSSTAGKYKGMNEIYALDGMLYVNVYHKDGTGIIGDCGSGVIGDTELHQFCLPTGKCPDGFYTTGSTGPNKIVLGGGILGTGLGLGYSNKSDEMSVIKGKEGSDCTKPENKNKPECQLFDTGARLQHLRWYESQ